jgi:acyl dehydratase
MFDKFWEDFSLGNVIKTDAITVTETHVVNFASFTGDYYPLHMDEEYAKNTSFGSRIAHGPLIFSIAVGLVSKANIFGNSIIAFLGLNNMFLKAPVRFGDTIYVKAEVIDKRETSKREKGITVMKYTVFNQHDEIVLTTEMNFMMRRKL